MTTGTCFQRIRQTFCCSARRKVKQPDLQHFSELEVLKKQIEEIAKAIPEKLAGVFKNFQERSFERIDQAQVRPGEMKKVADQIMAKDLIPCFKRMKRQDLDSFPKLLPPLLERALETERFSREMISEEDQEEADSTLELRINSFVSEERWAEAARLIRALNDDGTRKKKYIDFSKALYQANRGAEAIEEMDRDPEMESDDKEEVLAAVCGDCVEQNNLGAARRIAFKLKNPLFQSEAEGHLAYHFMKTNDLDSAEPHVERMKDPSWSSAALNDLSAKHLERCAPLRARSAAEKIPLDPARSNALVRIFEYFRERSQYYLAFFSTAKMPPPLKDEKRTHLFLDYLTKSGHVLESDLEGLLSTISDPHEKSRALWGYFDDWLEKEDYDQAHGVAQRIPEGPIRSAALKKLFQFRSAFGQIRACREIAGELSPGKAQTDSCVSLIDKVLKTHQFPRALTIADQIKDPEERKRQKARIKAEERRCLTEGVL